MEQEIRPEDYGYDGEAIAEQARENLKRNRPYQKLYEQMEQLDPMKDFVKRNYLMAQARQMEEKEILRLMELDNKRRMDVRRIGDFLEEHNPADSEKYESLMAGFAFLLDMIDFTLHDLNEILFRNKTDIKMENFPEIVKCRKLAEEMAGSDIKKMPQWQRDMWIYESDRLWNTLKERSSSYLKRAEREERKRISQK